MTRSSQSSRYYGSRRALGLAGAAAGVVVTVVSEVLEVHPVIAIPFAGGAGALAAWAYARWHMKRHTQPSGGSSDTGPTVPTSPPATPKRPSPPPATPNAPVPRERGTGGGLDERVLAKIGLILTAIGSAAAVASFINDLVSNK